MSNHGEDPGPLQPKIEAINAALEDDRPDDLGATNRFPRGKLTDDDEGGIRLRVAARGGVVVLDFGKPVSWIGFPPQEARDLCDSILKHARSIETVNAVLTTRGGGRG